MNWNATSPCGHADAGKPSFQIGGKVTAFSCDLVELESSARGKLTGYAQAGFHLFDLTTKAG